MANETKTYTIDVHYDAVKTIEVTASNENEAIELAKEKAEYEDFDAVFYTDACAI